MNKWFKVSGTVAMIAAAGVLTVSTISFAQSTEVAPENSDTSGLVQRGDRGNRGGRQGEFAGIKPDRAERAAMFAEALGISVEELEAAKEAGTNKEALIEELGLEEETVQANLQAAMVTHIQAQVTDGTITQEQADAMIERVESGEKGFGKRGGRGHHKSRPSLESLGLDADATQAEIQAALIANVEAKVADGTITQEQADAMIERIESGEKGFGRQGGRRGGRDFDGQRGGPQDDDSQQQGLRGAGPQGDQDA